MEEVGLTRVLCSPPYGEFDVAGPSRHMHQIDDVAMRFSRHRDPVHRNQLVSGTQAAIFIRRAVLYDRPDQDLHQTQRHHGTNVTHLNPVPDVYL